MKTRPWPLRYAVAVVAVAAALGLMMVPEIGRAFSGVIFFAVLISAWYGGLGPGLFATALTVVAAYIIIIMPLEHVPAWQVLSIAIYVLGEVIISVLVGALHTARQRAEAAQCRLAAVLTSIGDAVIATDSRGR